MQLNAGDLSSAVDRLVTAILSANSDGQFALVGLRSRGDEVAERILEQLASRGIEVPMGVLDISLYRDDLAHLNFNPKLQSSEIDFPVDGTHIIIVDDVLFTGRTVRSAIDALMDYGRPAKIELATLIDRGHRELPFAPDYTGVFLETERMDYVDVRLVQTDGEDAVMVTKNPA
ncbi:bifunctional pyr operon transcriptional regulator/uracil phosphoribosyltransferase PyrR [Verrucomicrobiaceae bacterium N1E253]|uniref:Bifunctional protein PyrR n=2 Tax=Oceaniferula marina TaxID=2748318 RepID=A0A851GHT8_9BACT|nr:bifunctional pyr operon transcriptional regulator/uracil phosphoribosyltransferase PyrR [Oceaniferula marina]